MRNVISLVLGGGRGTRLYPLTKYRSKPAVPLAGKYRLIDIPLSNCINSQLTRIYVLTQFMSVSLHRHIRRTYQFDPFSGGFVELLAAQQTMDSGTDWYQGTADAVRKNARYLEGHDVDYVLILSGDQLYQMDFSELVKTHRDSGANVTIAALPVDRDSAKSLGVMRADDSGRVVDFVEKPSEESELDRVCMSPEWMEQRGVTSDGRDCLASMGIYLFNRDTLLSTLHGTSHQDFGKEIFPTAIKTQHVQVHLFDGYWEDIGTIRAFYDANLALAGGDPPFNLASAEAPVYSRARFLPPSRLDGTTVRKSLIADGCKIGQNTTVENSIIGLRCIIGEGTVIRNSILMGSDFYETRATLRDAQQHGTPPVAIGNNCHIDGAIIDKNCHIGDGVRIDNSQNIVDSEEDSRCVIRDGIPVVLKGAVLPSNWSSNSLREAGHHQNA